MDTALSQNEREALSRFLDKVIADVDKVAALFEARGEDASLPRKAQAHLQATLAVLQEPGPEFDSHFDLDLEFSAPIRACIPQNC